jgi:hypothetical protein
LSHTHSLSTIADEDPEAKECMLKYHLRKAIQQTERVYDLMLGA